MFCRYNAEKYCHSHPYCTHVDIFRLQSDFKVKQMLVLVEM